MEIGTKIREEGEFDKKYSSYKFKLMKRLLFLTIGLLLAFSVKANYLRINNVSYDLSTSNVNFDITWNNSWRVDTMGAPFNWDAAWVIVKFRDCNAFPTDPWTHGLVNVSTGASNFANLEPILNNGTVGISPAPNNTGVMLRHPSNGIRPTFPLQNITLNLSNLPASGDLDLRVLGIEMVYVPQGQFLLDASTLVTSQSTVYPNGYEAFHCMKYEISQQQYAEFLNTISSIQASTRFPNSTASRHTIQNTAAPPSQYFASRPDRACNYLSWQDVQAYLDWAALRPMHQDEFIKACRGSGPVIPNEYAWGSNVIVEALQIGSIVEDGTETILTPNANCHFLNNAISGGDGGSGPLRVGIFATSSTTTRQQTGATYFGIMEMSGNVYEYVVHNSYNPNAFDGAWGDGNLNAASEADVATWPLNAYGGIKGGGWTAASSNCELDYLSTNYWTSRRDWSGGRGVR